MKIADYTGEKGIMKLADLIEPAAEIMTDEAFQSAIKAGDKLKAVKQAMKGHARAVLTIMAIIDDKDPETYEPNILELPKLLLDLLNDPDIINLFTSQAQNAE